MAGHSLTSRVKNLRVNIYIRKENEEAWARSGKSDWINNLLEKPVSIDIDKKIAAAQAAKGVEFCVHEKVKGFCKKGCRWNA